MGINDAIDAIILGLHEIFGDDYTYYPENRGQGMELPCFFVRYLNGSENLLVGTRYSSKSHFVIRGHAKDDINKNASLNDIATKLNELEYIRLKNGDLIELKNREVKVEGGIVICFVDINVHIIKQKEQVDSIGNISINGGLKENG